MQGQDYKIGTKASPSRSVFLPLLGGLKPSLCRTFIFSWRMVSKAISMDSRLLSWDLYVCTSQRTFKPPMHPNHWTIEKETSRFHLVMAVVPLSALHAALIVCQALSGQQMHSSSTELIVVLCHEEAPRRRTHIIQVVTGILHLLKGAISPHSKPPAGSLLNLAPVRDNYEHILCRDRFLKTMPCREARL